MNIFQELKFAEHQAIIKAQHSLFLKRRKLQKKNRSTAEIAWRYSFAEARIKNKVFNQYKYQVYNEIQKALDKILPKKVEAKLKTFVDIKEI